MQVQIQQVREKCNEVFAKASAYWPHLDFKNVDVQFDLKGRCAGMAGWCGTRYYMRFNGDMLTRDAFDHVLNDTVPHEVAHLVCFMDKSLGRNHDSGWCNVCLKLGGSGSRCHNEEVVMGKGTTYEYTSTTGQKHRIGDKHHREIQQNGRVLRYRKNGGNVDKGCAYSIVGHQGRTLAAPIVKKAVSDPVVNTHINLVGDARTLLKELFPAAVPNILPRFVAPVVPAAAHYGESKASISRRLMVNGRAAGKSYETIISEMMAANGYNRQLARGTFKANAPKVGIPSSFYE